MLVEKQQTLCMTHKFVDDTTLSAIVAKSATSYMQECCNELVEQSQDARMIVNGCKTKETMTSRSVFNTKCSVLSFDRFHNCNGNKYTILVFNSATQANSA